MPIASVLTQKAYPMTTEPIFLLLGLLGFILLISAISRVKGQNLQLESSEREYLRDRAYDLLMNSELSTASVDINMQIIFCNNRFASIFHSSPENLLGKNLLEHFPFPKVGTFYQTLEKIRQLKQVPKRATLFGIRLENHPGNDAEIDFFAMVRPFAEGNKDLIFIAMTFPGNAELFLDDMVKSLREKDKDLKELEEIDNLKSEFLATLSHELKTPLVSIKGYMDLMESEKFGPLTEGQRKALCISLKNTSHLNSMISSILNFARMEAGKLKFDLAQQRLGSLVNDTIDSMKPIADKSNISISYETPPELPWVLIDAELINRVLINLLDNAIKFSENDSKILIKAQETPDQAVEISVIDCGCGIPEDKLDKIKRPFYQADKSDTRPKGGLGLGLAICEKILAGHGTSLKIISSAQGTSVSFSLKTTQPRVNITDKS